jgi:hypothetical protein
MQRVQDALSRQLEKLRDQVVLEAREKDEQLRKVLKERESLGVELFDILSIFLKIHTYRSSIQQELAKLRDAVNIAQDEYQDAAAKRVEAEKILADYKAGYQKQIEDLEEQRAKYIAHQKDLDKVNLLILQVEQKYPTAEILQLLII